MTEGRLRRSRREVEERSDGFEPGSEAGDYATVVPNSEPMA